jgi:hypothetical protein
MEAQRNALMDRLCNGGGGDGDGALGPVGIADMETFQQLSRVRLTMLMNSLPHCLAFFDSILSIEQFCDYSLAVYPRSLNLMQLRLAIQAHLDKLRADASASAAPLSAA